MKDEQIQKILQQFVIDGEFFEAQPFGCGHINTTYAVYFRFENKPTVRYILQKINTNVFKEPVQLMENIAAVTEYLRRVIGEAGGDPARETLTLVPAKDGKSYVVDENGGYWRTYLFIENATCYQLADPEKFYWSARAFGRFQQRLRDFDAERLHDTIPRFHDSENRLENFEKSVAADVKGRAASAGDEIAFVRARKALCSVVLDGIRDGSIPLRVSHNDTKLNNVMFDNESARALCVIDLDTVMKGSILYDFGDSIRFGATTAEEDEADLSKVWFDLDKYDMYVKGFLEECGSILTEAEWRLLPEGAMLMTFECGMRFLADDLDGDVYFRIHKDRHNLIRARNQFKLVADMEAKLSEMRAIGEKYRR